MHLGHRVGALLLMGGEGTRFNSPIPKQFHELFGKKVYRHPLDTLLESHFFDEIILVCTPQWVEETKKETMLQVIPGGCTRQESSHAGLRAFQSPPDIVLIHDAVRPFVSIRILQNNIEKAILNGAVDTCIPSTDTLIFAPDQQTIQAIPKRSDYLRGQTPQTFQYPLILKAHEHALRQKITNATDDCQLILTLGLPVNITRGSEKNFKITSELDLHLAKSLGSSQSSFVPSERPFAATKKILS